jgi:general L-amino acid transport system permease protein
MAAIETSPESSFRVASLWTDKHYRGILIQILALIGLLAFIAYIVDNTLSNLEALGVETGYGFLAEPSNYDINQRLVEYDSRSTHGRAALVGILNTGLVAFCGILLATTIGFIAGVLRLSHNWVVNRLVYCYVEFTRNVPLLLQILLWYGIMVHTLPRPKQALEPASGFFLSNRGFAVPRPLFEDGSWLIAAAFLAAVAGAIWFARYAKRVQEATGKQYPVFTINLAMIVVLPVLAFLVMGGPVAIEWPALKGFNFQGGITIRPDFAALLWALSIYTGAFIAEIVRAGIQAVSHGQTEAAQALGLKSSWTMRLVILPQALRVIVPPLISQYLNLTKNSSLAIAVGYMDIVATIGGISLNQTGRALECMSIVLLLYLTFSLTISMVMNWYNKRVALVER